MTPREKREMLTNAIIDDIMSNPLESNNLDIIRDALETQLAHYAYDEIVKEYKERAIHE
jgi:hypothetical protein